MSDVEHRIYLTGFMGSGKSTIGPILANVLGYTFLDLDEVIEAEAGRSVQRLFAEEGETAFRALEAAVLRGTASREYVVIALGGGALTIEDNLRWTLEQGVVIYLRVPIRQLVQRLRRSRVVRPLLLDENGTMLSSAALHTKIQALLDQREPFYRRAHIILDVHKKRIGLTVDEAVEALRRYKKRRGA